MKKTKIAFILILVLGYIMPASLSAQSIRTSKINKCVIALKKHVNAQDAEVLLTPSGNLQLKATFDLRPLIKTGLIKVKEKGTTKLIAKQLILEVDWLKVDCSAKYVPVFVDSNGMATVVYIWNGHDMIFTK